MRFGHHLIESEDRFDIIIRSQSFYYYVWYLLQITVLALHNTLFILPD